MVTLRSVVLASASPRRLELLRSLGLHVEVAPSTYGEPETASHSPAELAQLHSRAKLEQVRRTRSTAVVVAADTVVDIDGRALGKPRDSDEAKRMLRLLSGRAHLVHTAYALAVPERAPVEEVRTTVVRFRALQPEDIAEYVATGESMDKAGAYGIQGRAAALIDSIDGDYFTVMGFPLGDFIRNLRRLGFSLPTAK